MANGFAKPTAVHVRDLRALLAAEPADVLVGDAGMIAGGLIAELGGPPFAAFGISVVGFPSRDLAPFGLGLAPAGGPAGRLRNRFLDRVSRTMLFGDMTREINLVRAGVGLPPTRQIVFEYPLASTLYLQLGAESFEYPRSDMPEQVQFVGPTRPLPDPAWRVPEWWSDLADDRPVVLVTQGTVATEDAQLLRPALEALATEDVLVVAVTGGPDPADLGPVPANARVERRIPFDALLPHVDVMVTNGGFGGVQLALAHGVPLVAAGRTEDKVEVAARVAHSGAGVDLRTQTPSAARLREAVSTVLAEPRYTLAARRIQGEIHHAGREDRAADLLEMLAATENERRAGRPAPAAGGQVAR
jgi:MGT family glycosyltransferase